MQTKSNINNQQQQQKSPLVNPGGAWGGEWVVPDGVEGRRVVEGRRRVLGLPGDVYSPLIHLRCRQ